MTSGKFDDPVEASFEAWQPDSPNLGERLSSLALTIAGIKFVPAKLWQILKDQFDRGSRFQRIEYLFKGIRLGFQRVQSDMREVAEQVKAVNTKLEGDRFREAVSVACEEAARATNDKKIQQMAAALVGYVGPTPSNWAAPDEDIASMIRDIAQLGDRDIQVLEILASVHASAVSHMPNLQNPDPFSRETPRLKRRIFIQLGLLSITDPSLKNVLHAIHRLIWSKRDFVGRIVLENPVQQLRVALAPHLP